MEAGSNPVPHGAKAISVSKCGIVLMGRFFFGLIFLMAAPNNFTKQRIAYATAQGAPLASIGVPLMGVISAVGGLSILLGYRAKIGAWLIVAFLVIVTPIMHRFWGQTDPMMAQVQMINFMKTSRWLAEHC